jgi:hypothetical protein
VRLDDRHALRRLDDFDPWFAADDRLLDVEHAP